MKTAFTCLFAAVLLSGCATFDLNQLIKDQVSNLPAPVAEAMTNDAPPIAVAPAPDAPAASDLPFNRAGCTFKRIDPSTLEWTVTRTLTVSKVTKDKVYSTCTPPEWPKRPDGLQGTFNLIVEQPDTNKVVVGSWDYNRATHQPMKGFANLYTNSKGENEHRFFNITKGCRFWVFTSASNRDAKRTVKERTNLCGPFIWEWEAPK